LSARLARDVVTNPRRRQARRGLALETAALAAIALALVPWVVRDALHQALPGLALVVVAPPAQDTDAIVTALQRLPGEVHVAPVAAQRAEELWRWFDVDEAAPRVMEGRLWPAAAIDEAELRARLAAAAPAAVVELRPARGASPLAAFWRASLLVVALALWQWRVRRGIRRGLKTEATTLALLVRFGATTDQLRHRLAVPAARPARRASWLGAMVGAGLGTAALALAAPNLFEPWGELATALAAATAVAVAGAIAAFDRLVTMVAWRRTAAMAGLRS